MICGLAILFGMSPSALAEETEYNQKLQELATLSGMSDTKQLDELASNQSSESGVSKETIVENTIISIKQQKITAKLYARLNSSNSKSTLGASGGGRATNTRLISADHRGDLFYSFNVTIKNELGHIGIYSYTNMVVEAPGAWKQSREVVPSDVYVTDRAELMEVKTTPEKRTEAAKKSRSYVNRGYLAQPVNKFDSGLLNCSQLVWLAYKKGAGIDLDSTPYDLGVMPYDIRNSKLTRTYKVARNNKWYRK